MFDYHEIPADLREQMEREESLIMVLSKPEDQTCMKCTATTRSLEKRNLRYSVSHTLDRDSNEEHVRFVFDKVGGMSAPAVIVLDEDKNVLNAWSDFRPENIYALAKEPSLVNA